MLCMVRTITKGVLCISSVGIVCFSLMVFSTLTISLEPSAAFYSALEPLALEALCKLTPGQVLLCVIVSVANVDPRKY
jgi:hypothetical protein